MGHPGPDERRRSRAGRRPYVVDRRRSRRSAAAARPDQLEALLEQLFKLFDAATLQQHVPVRAGWLHLLRLGQVALDEGAFHAVAAQPGAGDVSIVGEGNLELLAVLGAVPRDLTWREVMFALGLFPHVSHATASQYAISHACYSL